MKTVTSVSGGKSSAYMALHFPTDYYVFSCVLTDDPRATPKDPELFRECRERLPGFIGSREADLTLKNLLILEQKLGQKIHWISGLDSQYNPSLIKNKEGWLPDLLTYDRLIQNRKALPNRVQRWCTEQLKIYAIFWFVYLNLMEDDKDLVSMNIGFRADEVYRAEKMLDRCDKVKFPYKCPVNGKKKKVKHNWKSIDWRMLNFPMITNAVTNNIVKDYFRGKWDFPIVSNCDGCFFHKAWQLRYQNALDPDKFSWWKDLEYMYDANFKNGVSYKKILDGEKEALEDQLEQQGCFCTD